MSNKASSSLSSSSLSSSYKHRIKFIAMHYITLHMSVALICLACNTRIYHVTILLTPHDMVLLWCHIY